MVEVFTGEWPPVLDPFSQFPSSLVLILCCFHCFLVPYLAHLDFFFFANFASFSCRSHQEVGTDELACREQVLLFARWPSRQSAYCVPAVSSKGAPLAQPRQPLIFPDSMPSSSCPHSPRDAARTLITSALVPFLSRDARRSQSLWFIVCPRLHPCHPSSGLSCAGFGVFGLTVSPVSPLFHPCSGVTSLVTDSSACPFLPASGFLMLGQSCEHARHSVALAQAFCGPIAFLACTSSLVNVPRLPATGTLPSSCGSFSFPQRPAQQDLCGTLQGRDTHLLNSRLMRKCKSEVTCIVLLVRVIHDVE